MPFIVTDKLEREEGQAIFFKLGNNEATIISCLLEAYIDSIHKIVQHPRDEEEMLGAEGHMLGVCAIADDLNDMIQYWFRKDEGGV